MRLEVGDFHPEIAAAVLHYARWVTQVDGIEVWVPATLPECPLGMDAAL
jgi:hypothetical protein